VVKSVNKWWLVGIVSLCAFVGLNLEERMNDLHDHEKERRYNALFCVEENVINLHGAAARGGGGGDGDLYFADDELAAILGAVVSFFSLVSCSNVRAFLEILMCCGGCCWLKKKG